MKGIALPIISTIVDQHAEEAAFLWVLRDQSVHAPHYKPSDQKRLDDRVEAHLDGLRIAGPDGWSIAWEQFKEHAEPGEAFTVAVLAFEAGDAVRIEDVLTKAATKPVLGRAVTSALGWVPTAPLASLMSHPLPAVRRIGLAAHAIRRLNPGTALEKALNDTDLFLRSRALKMAGEMAYAVWLPLLKKHLKIADLPCRFQAARAAVLLAGDPAAVAELQAIALTESGYRQRGAELAIRRLDANAATNWLKTLLKMPGSERVALQAIAALGDPAQMPQVLTLMEQPALARLAGETFTMITGIELPANDLEGDRPADFEPGPNEDALDEDVSMDPDDGLPWPDTKRIASWWTAHQGKFPKGTRLLLGKPLTVPWLQHVVSNERQRLRAAAAIELFIQNPKVPLIETRGRFV